ncbi:MAG: CDP-alcohol phosphatidyltransferase family protein [Acidobacteria bacterium]|nr:CDP-alcohol phosphatidyltransferase family protein [Acidobacteriota bacterium]
MRHIPNLLCLARLGLAPFCAVAIVRGEYRLSLALFFLAGITDFFDGYLARRMSWASVWGAYLDPLADKALMAAAYVAMGVAHLAPWWLVALVFGRDLAILLGAAVLYRRVKQPGFPPSVTGKISTGVQIGSAVAILGVAAELLPLWFAPLGIVCTAAGTLASGIEYMLRGWRMIRSVNLAILLSLFSAALSSEPVRIETSGWKLWSHRPATAPRVYVDETVTRSGKGSLAVSGNNNASVHGGWEYAVRDIKPNAWYRFTAYCRTQGVAHPTWQILPRLDWQDARGKRSGQPEYVYQAREEGNWSRTWLEVRAPENAAGVVLQLYLSHAPAGIVWWDDVSFEEIAPPADRKARVAAINLRPDRTQSREENIERFLRAADQSAPGRLDMILFPEGMTVVGTGRSYVDVSEPVPGPSTAALGDYARRRNSWIVAGIYEAEGGAVYNTAVLIDRQGRLAGKYRKVYLPREEYERGLTPGNTFPVFDTDFGRVGIMICYDVFFSDPAKALAALGAEVILLPIWGGDETLAKARAIENRIFLVTSGYDHPTYIMDPDGERLSIAQERGTAAVYTIDLNRRYTHPHLGDMRGRRMKEQRTDVVIPPPRVDR